MSGIRHAKEFQRMTSDSILLVHDGSVPRPDVLGFLLSRYKVLPRRVRDLFGVKDENYALMVIDVRIGRASDLRQLCDALKAFTHKTIRKLFISDGPDRGTSLSAAAIGAAAHLSRPIRAQSLYPCVDKLIYSARREAAGPEARQAEGLRAGIDAIERILQFAVTGQSLTQAELYSEGDAVIDAMTETSLAEWVSVVKRHHSRTYRHSLLVTGIAVGFGKQLGFAHADLRRIALGGLLHDIGKACIPLEILEKPGQLTPDEYTIMKRHANMGREIMRQRGGFSPDLVDVVGQHHEFLDGSGYPDGLMGNSLSDFVRLITVADIFSALIEERSYKERLNSVDAYDIMIGMKGKLDPTLLGAFAHVAQRTSLAS